jgi:hypothetical protein
MRLVLTTVIDVYAWKEALPVERSHATALGESTSRRRVRLVAFRVTER